MSPNRVLIAGLPALLATSSACAQFGGVLELTPPGCERVGQCRLAHPLRFTDSAAVVWEAKADLVTDGASIPGIFQPFIGSPFDPSFIKAAVIHDYYCVNQVRPWPQTHRVFYDGLLAGGVSKAKAKTMYFAVVLGGPKWVKLKPGSSCGPNCVQNFKSTAGVSGVYARRADYSAPDIAPSVQLVARILEMNPDSMSVDELEKLARGLRPKDFFLSNGDVVDASLLGITE